MASKTLIGALVAGVAVAGAVVWYMGNGAGAGGGAVPVTSAMHAGAETEAAMAASNIVVPPLSGLAKEGEAAFNANCATCHGVNLAGTNQGPPLLHALYRPGHHGDGAIVSAAMNGVQAHHWRFGNMPPVEGITPQELSVIIAYIRAMQQANGIM